MTDLFGKRLSPGEQVIHDELERGPRTMEQLIEAYCAGTNGGPGTVRNCISIHMMNIRRKTGADITRQSVYRMEK